MKNSHPPFIATWILEHLTPGDRNDALSGDLLEEFRSGRPASWYWRQILAALAHDSLREIRDHWLAIVFAALWTIPARAWWFFALWPAAHQAGSILPWPYSTIFGMAVLVLVSLWVGLALYAGLHFLIGGNLRLEKVARGVWLGPLLFAVLGVAIRVLSHPLGIASANLGTAKIIIYFLSLVAAGWGIRARATSERKATDIRK
jgi:hypothetical protein